jgi:uncharacterized repeat protein (TIGR01451 family)
MFEPFQSRFCPAPSGPLARVLRLGVCALFVAASLTTWAPPAWAQLPPAAPLPVQAIITVPEAGPASPATLTPFALNCDGGASGTLEGCNGLSTNLSYQGTNRRLETFRAGGNDYRRVAIPGEAIAFRRNTVAGLENREVLFFESGTPNIPTPIVDGVPITLVPSASPVTQSVENVLLSPFVNRGIDNVFANVNAGTQDTQNNVQRVDYIVPNNLLPDVVDRDTEGFVVFERGGNDNFRIAAITEVTAGLPSAYGPLIALGPADWGGTNNIGVQFPSVVTRRQLDATGTPTEVYRVSHTVGNQFVRGIFFPVSALIPDNQTTLLGFSLFANDVTTDPVNFSTFPINTSSANGQGGLDLVSGGFGLFRLAPPQAPSLSLLKRITNLFGPTPLPDFSQVVGDGAALTLLQANGLGQGLDVIDNPTVLPGNGIEYTVYFANTSPTPANNVVLCDQIPEGLTFGPNSYGPGVGIQAIPASAAPVAPLVTYTNAADGDPGQFIPPGAALPPFCGVNRGNGAVVVNAGTVGGNQVGLIRFRTTVN